MNPQAYPDMNNTKDKKLIISGLFAAPFYLVLIFTLGVLEPGFSHLTKPMSLLGGVPGIRGMIFNVGVAFTGVLVIIFGLALWRKLPVKISAKIAFILFVMGGVGLIGAGMFHCNEGCKNILIEPNIVGRLHSVASLLTGMGTGLAPFFVWVAIRGSTNWKSFSMPTLMAAIFANLTGIMFWITFSTGFRLVSVEGLIQRLGFVIVLIWMFFIAMRLWRPLSHDK